MRLGGERCPFVGWPKLNSSGKSRTCKNAYLSMRRHLWRLSNPKLRIWGSGVRISPGAPKVQYLRDYLEYQEICHAE
jgi:hypothetical protein